MTITARSRRLGHVCTATRYGKLLYSLTVCIRCSHHFERQKQHITVIDLAIVPQFSMVLLHIAVIYLTKYFFVLLPAYISQRIIQRM